MRFAENKKKNNLPKILLKIIPVLPLYFAAYKTVSGVNGPLVILDDVKVSMKGLL